MNRFLVVFVVFFLFLGTGCVEDVGDWVPEPDAHLNPNNQVNQLEDSDLSEEGVVTFVVLPIEDYISGRTFKAFGEYISDRFTGYHAGDDVEFVNREEDVEVVAIADGTVLLIDDVSGYGGVLVVSHEVEDRQVAAIYGHIDLASVDVAMGDTVSMGQVLAVLGDHESEETDGERKHLHFALYENADIRLAGYEATERGLDNWINPQQFFSDYGLELTDTGRFYDSQGDLGGEEFNLSFAIPDGWELEYIPSLEALNLFVLAGEGSARKRSQVLIRYFDAEDFLTLSTVTIISSEEGVIGMGDYEARQYEIEKNQDVGNFQDQPIWRNKRHLVTDFRGEDGLTRYFVVASNPDLDPEIYQALLDSMIIK